MPLGSDTGTSSVIRRRPRSLPAAHQPAPIPFTSSSCTTTGRSGHSMISPRVSNFDRLEGGLGPNRMGIRNMAWKKVAFCITITVGVLWFLRPSRESVWPIKTPGEPLPQTFAVVGVEDRNELIFLQYGNHPRKLTPTIIVVPRSCPISPTYPLHLLHRLIPILPLLPPHPSRQLVPILPDRPPTSLTQIPAEPFSAPRRTARPCRWCNMRS